MVPRRKEKGHRSTGQLTSLPTGPHIIISWVSLTHHSDHDRTSPRQGKVVLDSLPENDFACQELLETVVDFLPKRYPTLFDRLLSSPSQDGNVAANPTDTDAKSMGGRSSAARDGIFNRVTKERYEWERGKAPNGRDALLIISRLARNMPATRQNSMQSLRAIVLYRLTECDFLMGREREDGHVYFVGGLVAFPG